MTATGGIALIVYLAAVVGIALVYRYRERLKETPLRVYLVYLIGVILALVFIVGALYLFMHLFLGFGSDVGEPRGYPAVAVDQCPGLAEITIASIGSVDKWGLVGPNGTKSTLATFEVGTRFTLRSNDEVIRYLNDPGNNITVLTTSGTKTVESVGELPTEYRKAPDGLINPDADISGYDNASVATVACLYNSPSDFELGGRRVPAEASVPCNTPVLAQNDSVMVGTSVESNYGTNADTILTSPITLGSGEYNVIGTVNGRENVVQEFTLEEALREQDEGNEDDNRTESNRSVAARLGVAGATPLALAGSEQAQGPRRYSVRNGKGQKGAV